MKGLLLLLLVGAWNVALPFPRCVRAANDPLNPPESFRLRPPKDTKVRLDAKEEKAVYIPRDLDDCFSELNKMLSKEDVARMKAGPEDEITSYYFSSSNGNVEVVERLNRWLYDRWQLYTASRLGKWFEERGLHDSSDMAEIICASFWRHLNNKPIQLEEQIKERWVYIPKDLDECFSELKKILSKKTVETMKTGPEGDMSLYHHGLGTWIRNKWGLWKGSHLAKWFNERGIRHPDDMSGIILRSFWRHLNNQPLKLDEQIKFYQDYWKKAKREQEQGRKKAAATP